MSDDLPGNRKRAQMSVSERDTPVLVARHNLPTSMMRVVGRDDFIQLIASDIAKSRLISIVGAGGIGKTTVALSIAERVIHLFRDGVWLVDFAPLQDPSLVAASLAATLGLAVHSSDVQAALCRFLRDRELLLVLDNCEHMVEAIASCVSEILDGAKCVHVLVTSREPLRIESEEISRLPGLATPPAEAKLSAEKALTYPAIELFVERATDRLETFVLSDVDAPVVAEICRRLDGIALAIELAAMRIDVFGATGLRKQLDDRFRVLGGRRAGLERHRTLAATLDWSYSLLAADEAAMLRAVSVFSGLFRADDAVALTDISRSDVEAMLAELVSKSLLSTDADSASVTYRPLESTRAYCLEKLRDSKEYGLFKRRRAEHLCEGLERAARETDEQRSQDWSAAQAPYLDDLRSALAWASEHAAYRSLLVRLTAAGTVLWNHFSLTHESRNHLVRAIAELETEGLSGTPVEMNLQLALAGSILHTRDGLPEAKAALQRALDIAEQATDNDARLRCLRLIAVYELFDGKNDASIHTLETFIKIAAVSDPSVLPEGETHLAVGEIFVGRLHTARRRMQRLYDQASLSGSGERFARYQYSNNVVVMSVLSHAQFFTGSPDTAASMTAQGIEYGRRAHHELSLCIGLGWACLLYHWIGDDENCRRHTEMLEDLMAKHGVVLWRPIAMFCRGALESRESDTLSSGIAGLKRAVAEFKAVGHMARLPYFIGVLAEALTAKGDLGPADETIREALDRAAAQNDKWCIPELLRIRAAIANANGQSDAAEELLMKSLSIAEEIEALPWRLRTSIDLAQLLQAQSRQPEARKMLQPIYQSFTEGFETRDLKNAARILDELSRQT